MTQLQIVTMEKVHQNDEFLYVFGISGGGIVVAGSNAITW